VGMRLCSSGKWVVCSMVVVSVRGAGALNAGAAGRRRL
jgi:hypothetical protein